VKKTGGDDAETRFAASLVEGAGGDIARKITTEVGELVVDPEGKLRAMTPERERAEHKDGVAKTGKKTESWTGTPIKHETSPRLGGKNQASS
jgi:hypothetical protein